jgi:tetratricopeptide (TPR) repeat protein
MHQRIIQNLSSNGTAGLSTLLRAGLSIFNHNENAHTDIIRLFETVFVPEFGSTDGSFYEFGMDEVGFTKVGSGQWGRCEIETPSSRQVFSGAGLFNQYWLSLAQGSTESDCAGEETVEFMAQAIQACPKDLRSLQLLCQAARSNWCMFYDVAELLDQIVGLMEQWLAESNDLDEPVLEYLLDFIDSLYGKYADRPDIDRGISCYSRLVRRFPTELRCRLALASAYRLAGMPREAIDTLQEAAILDHHCRAELSHAYFENGQLDAGVNACSNSSVLLAEVYRKQGKVKESIEVLKFATERNPTDANLCRELAFAYDDAGYPSLSAQTYERLCELENNNTNNWGWLAGAYMKLSMYDMAVVAYERAGRTWKCNMGQAALAAGKYDKALECIEESVEDTPYNPSVWDHLWSALRAKWDRDRAWELYEEARLYHQGTSYFSEIPMQKREG